MLTIVKYRKVFKLHRGLLNEVICLARSKIRQQIQEVDQAVQEHPECLDLLLFHKSILEILSTTGTPPTKAMKEALSDESVNTLLQRAVESKRPIISLLNAKIFDPDGILSVAKKVIERLIDEGSEAINELEGLLRALGQDEVETQKAIDAIIREDASWFKHLSEMYNIEPSLMLFIFDVPLRPFFEELARRVEKDIIETWWEPFCPVCGRVSAVARMRQRKRYMICTYCGAQYLVDLFLCVNCNNKDPTTMGFISFEASPGYELNYCEKCKHYIKVLHEDRLKGKIPQGLEDLLTRELDIIAEDPEFNLKRV